MAPLTQWNKAVKQAFKAGRKTNKFYSLKDAMFDAKKIYKKGENSATSLANSTRKMIGMKKRDRGTRRR